MTARAAIWIVGAPGALNRSVGEREVMISSADWVNRGIDELKGRTSLDDGQYAKALRSTLDFLRREEEVTNSKLRTLTGLNYDQAIKFFTRATGSGVLARRGVAGGTHYVLPQVKPE